MNTNTILIDTNNFQLGALAFRADDIEQLYRMAKRVTQLEKQGKNDLVQKIITHTQESGYELAKLRAARNALARKLLWCNSQIRLMTGRPFINECIDMDNDMIIRELCDTWIHTMTGFC